MVAARPGEVRLSRSGEFREYDAAHCGSLLCGAVGDRQATAFAAAALHCAALRITAATRVSRRRRSSATYLAQAVSRYRVTSGTGGGASRRIDDDHPVCLLRRGHRAPHRD